MLQHHPIPPLIPSEHGEVVLGVRREHAARFHVDVHFGGTIGRMLEED